MHRVAQLEHPHRRADDAGHRADRAVVVARVERDAVAATTSALLGLLRRSSASPSKQHRADQRAAQRPGRAVPADRRPGVQERRRGSSPSASDAGPTSTSSAPADEHPLDRGRVGRGAPRVGEHPARAPPRCPSPAAAASRPGSTGTACAASASANSETPAADHDAAPGRAGVIAASCASCGGARGPRRRWTGAPTAPAARSASACRRQALRVAVGAAQRDDHGERRGRRLPRSAPLGDRRRQLGGRVRVRAVPEHDVEQQHGRARVGGLGGEPLQPRRAGRSSGGRGPGSARRRRSRSSVPVGAQVVGRAPSPARSGMLDRDRPRAPAAAMTIASSQSVPPANSPRSDAGAGAARGCWCPGPRLGPGCRRPPRPPAARRRR